MSRIFLAVLVAGAFCFTSVASADTPKCNCILSCGDDLDGPYRHGQNKRPWDMPVGGCLMSCPGSKAEPNHALGSALDWRFCLWTDDACTVPLVGFDCVRLYLGEVVADSICVCQEECPSSGGDFPYVYPYAPTDATGCSGFRWRGTILALYGDAVDNAYLQVCGCQDQIVCFRSPDVNANCEVGLEDFVIFAGTFGMDAPGPPFGPPVGLQYYTVYNLHCAPSEGPALPDFVTFATHFGHTCPDAPVGPIPGDCDP